MIRPSPDGGTIVIRTIWAGAASLALFAALPATAQEAAQPATPEPAAAYAAPDPASLTMPKLEFTPTQVDIDNYDKYFYFHREGTSFAEAYNDIRECDALASGSNIYLGGSDAAEGMMSTYGPLAGGIGSAVGSAMADAIFGSAARRAQRRQSMRNCMGFKAYKRYPLNGDLWKEFNFEEGLGRKKEAVRLDALALQALVASGPTPKTEDLGL